MSSKAKEKVIEVINVSLGLGYAIEAIGKLQEMAFDDMSDDPQKEVVAAALKNHREGLESLLGCYDIQQFDEELLSVAEKIMADSEGVKRHLDS